MDDVETLRLQLGDDDFRERERRERGERERRHTEREKGSAHPRKISLIRGC